MEKDCVWLDRMRIEMLLPRLSAFLFFLVIVYIQRYQGEGTTFASISPRPRSSSKSNPSPLCHEQVLLIYKKRSSEMPCGREMQTMGSQECQTGTVFNACLQRFHYRSLTREVRLAIELANLHH